MWSTEVAAELEKLWLELNNSGIISSPFSSEFKSTRDGQRPQSEAQYKADLVTAMSRRPFTIVSANFVFLSLSDSQAILRSLACYYDKKTGELFHMQDRHDSFTKKDNQPWLLFEASATTVFGSYPDLTEVGRDEELFRKLRQRRRSSVALRPTDRRLSTIVSAQLENADEMPVEKPLLNRAPTAATASVPTTGIPEDLNLKPRWSPETNHFFLDNGMAAFLIHHPVPKGRVFFRLLVHVGSADETDSEQGIAHLLEHMAFRSTEHFAKNNEIGAMMREMGIDFGADMNAQTGFDHTAYDLVVPVHEDNWLADDLSRIEKAVQVLADWGGRIQFHPDLVEAEKSVVIAELQTRDWTNSGIPYDRQFCVRNTRFENRDPIGKLATLQRATADSLRTFFQKWYQPERMSFMAIGDMGKADIQALKSCITTHFQYERAPKQGLSSSIASVEFSSPSPSLDSSSLGSSSLGSSSLDSSSLGSSSLGSGGSLDSSSRVPLIRSESRLRERLRRASLISNVPSCAGPEFKLLPPADNSVDEDVCRVEFVFKRLAPLRTSYDAAIARQEEKFGDVVAVIGILLELRLGKVLDEISRVAFGTEVDARVCGHVRSTILVVETPVSAALTVVGVVWQELERLKRFLLRDDECAYLCNWLIKLVSSVTQASSTDHRTSLTDALLHFDDYHYNLIDILHDEAKQAECRENCTALNILQVAKTLFNWEKPGFSLVTMTLPNGSEAVSEIQLQEAWSSFIARSAEITSIPSWLPDGHMPENAEPVLVRYARELEEENAPRGKIVKFEYLPKAEAVQIRLSNGVTAFLKCTQDLASAELDEHSFGFECEVAADTGILPFVMQGRARHAEAHFASLYAGLISKGHVSLADDKRLRFEDMIVCQLGVETFSRTLKLRCLRECTFQSFGELLLVLNRLFAHNEEQPWTDAQIAEARRLALDDTSFSTRLSYGVDLAIQMYPQLKEVFTPFSKEEFLAVSPLVSQECMRLLFGNPEDFTFVFVGKLPFQPSACLPGEETALSLLGSDLVDLLETRLGTISTQAPPQIAAMRSSLLWLQPRLELFPPMDEEKIVWRVGHTEISGEQHASLTRVTLVLEWPFAYELTAEAEHVVTELLHFFLVQQIRESLGATYTIQVLVSRLHTVLPGRLMISFFCVPTNCFYLVQVVQLVLGLLATSDEALFQQVLVRLIAANRTRNDSASLARTSVAAPSAPPPSSSPPPPPCPRPFTDSPSPSSSIPQSSSAPSPPTPPLSVPASSLSASPPPSTSAASPPPSSAPAPPPSTPPSAVSPPIPRSASASSVSSPTPLPLSAPPPPVPLPSAALPSAAPLPTSAAPSPASAAPPPASAAPPPASAAPPPASAAPSPASAASPPASAAPPPASAPSAAASAFADKSDQWLKQQLLAEFTPLSAAKIHIRKIGEHFTYMTGCSPAHIGDLMLAEELVRQRAIVENQVNASLSTKGNWTQLLARGQRHSADDPEESKQTEEGKPKPPEECKQQKAPIEEGKQTPPEEGKQKTPEEAKQPREDSRKAEEDDETAAMLSLMAEEPEPTEEVRGPVTAAQLTVPLLRQIYTIVAKNSLVYLGVPAEWRSATAAICAQLSGPSA